MKKRLAGLLLLLVLSVIAVACAARGESTDGTDGVTSSEATSPVTTTPVTEEGEPLDASLYGWFEKGSALVYRDDFEKKDVNEIAFYMAKNEKQGYQYILTSGVDHEGLRCEVSDLSDGQGNTLRGEVQVAWYTGLRKIYGAYERGYVPTALLPQDDPFQGGTFAVKAGRSKTLYVQYQTTKDTVPGIYTGTLEIKKGDEVLLSGEVTLTVWDIYYEEKTALHTEFGYGFSPLLPEHPEHVPVPKSAPAIRNDADPDLVVAYADYLLDYRLSIGRFPYENSLLDEGVEKYMDNPRVSSICLTNHYKLEEQYAKAVEKGWVDRVHFMQYDEPHADLHVQMILGGARDIAARFPTTRHQNPLLCWNYYEGDKNIIDVLSEVTTLHCVKSSFYKGDIRASLDRLKAERGDTVLWYTCGDQPYNMIDLLPCVPGTEKEILFWQLYQCNLDGYLCWSTTWWYHQDDIWEEGYEEQRLKFPQYGLGPTGMGVILYWHPETKMPVSTLSLTATCDGIEDYQLIAMADEVLGRDVVLPLVEKITTSPTSFIKDADLLEQVRVELAEALLAATAQ